MPRKGAQPVGIGSRIRQYREASGLSQLAVAKGAGLDSGHLARIERGVIRSPAVSRIQAIAKVLGVPASTLIGEETRNNGTLIGSVMQSDEITEGQKRVVIALIQELTRKR